MTKAKIYDCFKFFVGLNLEKADKHQIKYIIP